MANQYSSEGSSTSNVSGEGSDATVQLNIKTLDSQIYSFQADKNMPVSVFKEKIANAIGVPVGQQRLIFRGKVLKDEHLLSEYQVENGHTLHLVARQPSQSQPSADTGSGDTNENSGNRGNDAGAGAPRNPVSHISHSVVLGTLNVGDQGEGIVPDLSRVIGAVLNSFGISGQAATNGIGGLQAPTLRNVAGQVPQGNETGGSRSNVGGQGHVGNQTESGQAFPGQPFQPAHRAVRIPAAPIPDSLSTLNEFMSHMERALAENGYQPNTSSTGTGDLPRVELPSNARGVPTLEALSIVLRHAERLLSGHTITALSQIAGRLEQEGASTDPTVREQIQTESVQVGRAMHDLGALFLELGRAILTLHMGRSPAESSVNPGPAVYISQSGSNPIMVQPFPLQTNSLFGGSVSPSNPMTLGHLGIGTAPRHINIHIHAGTSLAPVLSAAGAWTINGDRTQGELSGSTGPGPELAHQLRNVIAAAIPSRSTGVTASNAAQTGLGVSISQPPSDSVSLSSRIDEINSQLRNLAGNRQGENQTASGSIGSVAGNDAVSNAAQPDLGASILHSPSDSASLSSVVDEINSQLRYLAGSRQEENQPAPGDDAGNEQPNSMVVNEVGESIVSLAGVMTESDGQKMPDEGTQGSNNEAKESLLSSKDASSSSVGCSSGDTSLRSEDASENAQISSEKHELPGSGKAVPLGLGLGSLERKKRTREPKSVVRSGDSGTSNTPSNQNLNTGMSGQQLLQSLASRSSGTNRVAASDTPSGQLPFVGQVMEGRPLGEQGSGGQFDTASAMSQVLHSPALSSLLTGVSEQTGVGSPNVLRNMLQQLSQSPQIMNTVSQIAQQVDSQDFGNMFSGLVSGQGGGIDLSRMIQQMMPVVSQVLGGASATQPFPTMEPEPQLQHNERGLSGSESADDNNNIQINLQEVAQRIEHFNTPGDVFSAVVENAIRLNGNGTGHEDILRQLSNNEDLAGDYIDMLQRDIQRRLQGDSAQDEC